MVKEAPMGLFDIDGEVDEVHEMVQLTAPTVSQAETDKDVPNPAWEAWNTRILTTTMPHRRNNFPTKSVKQAMKHVKLANESSA